MEMLVFIGAIILWCLLFAVCFWTGPVIIDRIYRKQQKQVTDEAEGAEAEKKAFRIYTICFFVIIPILSIAALFTEG